MEDIRDQFTDCLRQTIKEKVDEQQDIEEQMKHELLQYVDLNSPQGKDLDLRLHFLFQKLKVTELGITEQELERVKDPQNEDIPKVIQFIADILEDLLSQMHQQEEDMPQTWKSLFLIFNKNDPRFKKFKKPEEQNEYNLNSSDSDSDDDSDDSNGNQNKQHRHEKDIDAALLMVLQEKMGKNDDDDEEEQS